MPQVSRVNVGDPNEKMLREIDKIPLPAHEITADFTENTASQSCDNQTKTLPSPNWDLWRSRGACRIWKAVLISMEIKPSPKVRTQLRLEKYHLYKEYVRRKKDVIAHYGLHPDFRAMQHANAGKKSGEQYILLSNLLSFAKKHRWKNLEAFEQGMQIPVHESGTGHISNVSFEVLPEETRNGLVRTGALLKLLEDVLLQREVINPAALLHGGKLNISMVAVLPDTNGINLLSPVMQNKLRLWLLGDVLAFSRGVSKDAYRDARKKVKTATGIDIECSRNPVLQAAAFTTIRQLFERGLGFKTYEEKWGLLVQSAHKNHG